MKYSLLRISKLVICVFSFLSVIACKTISIQGESQVMTKQQMMLGAVGSEKDYLLNKDYNPIAIPKYEKSIRLKVSLLEFTNKTFTVFEEASKAQSNDVSIIYQDTLPMKPKYVKLEILDRLEVLNSLNADHNLDVFEFLKNSTNAHLVTTIVIAFNHEELDMILTAEEIFLESSGLKNYSINLYNKGERQKVIQFNEGVVFAFQKSNPCWKQNDKYQLEIIDLVEHNDKCPSRSFRSSNHAKKKINYYKF